MAFLVLPELVWFIILVLISFCAGNYTQLTTEPVMPSYTSETIMPSYTSMISTPPYTTTEMITSSTPLGTTTATYHQTITITVLDYCPLTQSALTPTSTTSAPPLPAGTTALPIGYATTVWLPVTMFATVTICLSSSTPSITPTPTSLLPTSTIQTTTMPITTTIAPTTPMSTTTTAAITTPLSTMTTPETTSTTTTTTTSTTTTTTPPPANTTISTPTPLSTCSRFNTTRDTLFEQVGMRNTSVDLGKIWQTTTSNVIRCGRHCLCDPDCMSVFYDRSLSQCTGHSAVFNTTGTFTPSVNYYIVL